MKYIVAPLLILFALPSVALADDGDGFVEITPIPPAVGDAWPISPTNPYIFDWSGSKLTITAINASGKKFKDMHVYVYRTNGAVVVQKVILLSGPGLYQSCTYCYTVDGDIGNGYQIDPGKFFTISVSSFLITKDNYKIKVTPSIPEPASWAMMVAGFGLVGGASRYRRRQAA